MATSIGHVREVDGNYFVRSSDGVVKKLEHGDPINVDDVVYGQEGNTGYENILITLEEGLPFDVLLASDESQLFDASMIDMAFDEDETQVELASIEAYIEELSDHSEKIEETESNESVQMLSEDASGVSTTEFAEHDVTTVDVTADERTMTDVDDVVADISDERKSTPAVDLSHLIAIADDAADAADKAARIANTKAALVNDAATTADKEPTPENIDAVETIEKEARLAEQDATEAAKIAREAAELLEHSADTAQLEIPVSVSRANIAANGAENAAINATNAATISEATTDDVIAMLVQSAQDAADAANIAAQQAQEAAIVANNKSASVFDDSTVSNIEAAEIAQTVATEAAANATAAAVAAESIADRAAAAAEAGDEIISAAVTHARDAADNADSASINATGAVTESGSLIDSMIETANAFAATASKNATAQSVQATATTAEATVMQRAADEKESVSDELLSQARMAKEAITSQENSTLDDAEVAGKAAIDGADAYVIATTTLLAKAEDVLTETIEAVDAAQRAVDATQVAYDKAVAADEKTTADRAALDAAMLVKREADVLLEGAGATKKLAEDKLIDADATLTVATELDHAIESATDAIVQNAVDVAQSTVDSADTKAIAVDEAATAAADPSVANLETAEIAQEEAIDSAETATTADTAQDAVEAYSATATAVNETMSDSSAINTAITNSITATTAAADSEAVTDDLRAAIADQDITTDDGSSERESLLIGAGEDVLVNKVLEAEADKDHLLLSDSDDVFGDRSLFTVSMDIDLNAAVNDDTYVLFFDPSIYLLIEPDGIVRYGEVGLDAGDDSKSVDIVSTQKVDLESAHNIIVLKDGSTVVLLVDGEVILTDVNMTESITKAVGSDVSFGADETSNTDGTISNVQIFDSALSTIDVATVASGGQVDAPLIVDIDFEGDDPLADKSGNGHALLVGTDVDELIDDETGSETIASDTEGPVDAGLGLDTQILTEDVVIDFDVISTNISNIDLNSGDKTIGQLAISDVLDITPTDGHTLRISGDSGDTIKLDHINDSSAAEWTKAAESIIGDDGHTYDVYTGSSGADTVTVQIDQNVVVTDF